MKKLLLIASLALTACGSHPDVKIDSTEAQDFAQGNHVVGLLQVRNVNSGQAFGIRVQETYNDSFYCTVSAVSPDIVVTSTDCLQTIKQNTGGSTATATSTGTSSQTTYTIVFDPKDMFIYFPVPGKLQATSFGVKSILGTDGANHLAYLRLESPVAGGVLSSGLRMQSQNSVSGNLTGAPVSAVAVSATAPDKDGISHLRRSDVTVAFTASPAVATPVAPDKGSGITITATATGTATATATSTSTNTNTATDATVAPPPAPNAKPAVLPSTSPLTQPQSITVSGLKDGSFGSPVFYSGSMVGIVQNGDASQVTNAQWVVTSGSTLPQ